MNKSDLKKEYKALIRDGRELEANIKLREIWNYTNKEEEKDMGDLDKLIDIKGIGIETLEDIKRIYSNEKELILALQNNKVPLMNSVVKKLITYYNL